MNTVSRWTTVVACVVAGIAVIGCSPTEDDAPELVSSRVDAISQFTGPVSFDLPALVLQPDGTVVASSWVATSQYNPTTNLWTARAAPPVFLTGGCFIGLPGGKVLRAGANNTTTTIIFNPATNTWLTAGSLNFARNSASCGVLADGRVLLFGGIQQDNQKVAEVFDPNTNQWTVIGNANGGSSSSTAVRLLDGRLLFPEGPQIFDPSNNTFRIVGSIGQIYSRGVLLNDGRVLLLRSGGADLFDPVSGLYTVLPQPLVTRQNVTATLLSDGRVLVAGGELSNTTTFADVDLFDPVTNTWASAPPLLRARGRHSAVLLAPGKVLLVGGYFFSGGSSQQLPSNMCGEIDDVGCAAASCASASYQCGTPSDGCGVPLSCGTCAPELMCVNSQCQACTPVSCASLGGTCGAVSDGCGNTLSCGTCGAAQNCVANTCAVAPLQEQQLALFDPARGAPACNTASAWCDSGALLAGRAGAGPEAHAPNTLGSTCADGTFGGFHASPSIDRIVVRGSGTSLRPGVTAFIDTTVWVDAPAINRLDLYSASNAASPSWTLIASITPSNFTGLQTLTGAFTLPSGSLQAIRAQFRVGGSSASPCSTGTSDDHDDLVFATPSVDGAPPTIYLFAPSWNATLRGTANTSINVQDGFGIGTVSLFDGASLLGTISGHGGSIPWDTLTAAEGRHYLRATATDPTGNIATAPILQVVVNNAPLVSLLAPSGGATISGTASLQASATAVTGRTISNVEFLVDGNLVGAVALSPYTLSWDSRTLGNGAHTVSARATDSGGLVTTSPSISVSLQNDFTPPAVAITNPAANATVRGLANFTATATDSSGVASVQFFADASSLAMVTAAPFGTVWDTRLATQGAHELRADALDAFGNPATTSIFVTVDNAPWVTVTSPGAGATLQGLVSLAGTASAVEGRTLTSVDFVIDDLVVGSATVEPYGFQWNSRSVTNGAHSVKARATDSAGLITETAAIGVTTNNDFVAPVPVISSPVSGAVVRGVVTITGSATDDVALLSSELAIDGVPLASGLASPFSVPWSSTSVADGPHAVQLHSVDSSGNGADTSLSVIVDNTNPTVAVTSPSAGPLAAGSITVTASASDGNGIAQVAFFVDGSLIGADSSAPFSVLWTTAPLLGAHVLTAVATDLAGNVGTSAPVNVVIAGSQTAAYSSTFKTPWCSTLSTSCSTGTLVNGRGTVGPELNRPNTIDATCADGNNGNYHASGESNDAVSVSSVAGGPMIAGTSVRVTATLWATQSGDRVDIWSASNASSPSWTLRATLTPTVFNAVSTVSTTFTLPTGTTQAVRVSLRRNGSATTCPSGNTNDRDDLVFVTN